MLMKDIMTTEYLLERFGRDPADHILALWSRLKKSFNTFLKGGNRVFWNCTEVNFTYDNLEEAPLITLLSEGPLPTAGDSVDFLFLVIHDLVSKYNSIVERYRVARDQDTDETLSIEPELILPGSGGSVLIRLVPQLSGPELDALAIGAWDSQMQAFDNEYLAGQLHFHLKSDCQSFLPVISSPQSSLREPFVFREDTNDMPTGRSDSGLVFALPGSYYFAREEDLRLIRTAQQMLGALGFSGGNENGISSILNSTFYNVDSYENLVSILRGLCSFLECLITQDTIEIKQTVRQTLESLFHQRDKQELLDCVGFPELNSEQCTTLSSLKPNQLASSVDYFAFQLASEGFNFASLDLCMTAPITAEEKATLEERFSRLIVRPNSTRKALEDLDSFVDHTLEFYKNQIRDEALRHGSSLRDFLKTSNFCCEETDPVLGILPRSVTVRNYVPLRQLLQQMRLSLLWHATNVDDEETEETATLRPEKCWLWTDESAKVANNSAMKDTPRSAKETGVAETDTEKFRRLSEYRRNSAATRIQRWWRYNYASLEASRKSRQESSDENHQSTPMVEDDLSSDGASPMLEDDLSSDGGYDMESPDFSRISFEGEEFFDPLEEYTFSKELSSFGNDPNVDFVQSCPPLPESHPDHEEFEDTMQEDPSEWRDVEDEKKSEDGDDGSAVNTFLSDWILDNQLDHSVGEALQRMGVRSLEDIRMVVKVDELLARLQLAPLDEYKLKLAVQSQPASFGQWLWDSFSFFR